MSVVLVLQMEWNYNSMIAPESQVVRRPQVPRQVTNIFKCYRMKRHDDKSFIVFVELGNISKQDSVQ